ncbi:alpha-D-ribose 1-methylphosphonate 5-triphosphate diphosphatase [Marinimicrococcus flavescens]|uniref:Alpha-D-ribose 1-methylphosphonate 5-triphosphate diphosphatase n=1 Tax=Marinimicrococcus flavescens TaxID=3031815 RepID=A0AAP3XQW5_9PROT|nr:alpha-D-ribose 1-methylphosphonate 5-triphosphate diphosphatase [Marinimicrococcus flavescens]
MSEPQILANARIVTPEAVIEGGVVMREGVIAAVERGDNVPAGAADLRGDLLIPGLVELHTDNLEKHYAPRAGVEWDPVAAAISHDTQLAGSGITTVYDSLVIGAAMGWDMRDSWLAPMLGGLRRARDGGMLKIDHRLHLRCEITHPEIGAIFERYCEEPGLGVMSLMDHAPGDRQSPDIEAYKKRYRSQIGMSHEQVEAHVAGLIESSRLHGPENRRLLGEQARRRGIALASHDDARREHVEEAAALGCVVSEFPTTMEAAEAARAHGLQVLMGAPNLIRGGSHSGNVAAGDLVRAGLLDIISSDYIPASLVMAAFSLAREPFGLSLPDALATVTSNPARAAGLDDRGRIEVGLRGDLVRVRLVDGRPVVRGVWVQGERVA